MVSVTIIDEPAARCPGQTVEAFWNSSRTRRCSPSASTARSAPRRCGRTSRSSPTLAPVYISCYPNAGLPNALGEFDQTPDAMADAAGRIRRERLAEHRRRLLRHDARSHPRHRRGRARASAARAADGPSASAPQRHSSRSRSGPTANFIMVGERTNITGSPKFARLIKAGDYEAALAIARQQVDGGANILDVNMDEGLLDGEKAMTRVPSPGRRRARHRPRADHDRQLEVVGASKRA